MAAQGTGFDTPRACPFVALELDRDRRSDTPDYRHRCFAEPTPAPRSIAHQEAYCLSPNFPACPVFQDWAVRAAARPIASGGSSAATLSGAAMVGGAAAAGGAATGEADDDDEAFAARGATETTWSANTTGTPTVADDPAIVDLPEDASVTPAGAEIAAAAAAATGMASPPTFATTWENPEAAEAEQLGAFDPAGSDPHSSYREPDAGYPEPAVAPAFVPPPAPPRQQPQTPSASEPPREAATAAVPAFLAGRATQPTNPQPQSGAAIPPPRPASSARDDIVPSWDIDGRYGAESPSDAPGGNRLDGILTAIAVVAILGLGVAAVLFLPGLLSKGKPAATPVPSIVISSAAPSAAASGVASLSPSTAASVAPTRAPSEAASQGPGSSPRSYRIKAGDSLARIANRFGVTVQDILDANPNIPNADNIFVGQVIVIPVAAASSP